MTHNIWQSCIQCSLIVTRTNTMWSRLNPLIPFRLCSSSTSLPVTVHRVMLQQKSPRGRGCASSGFLQPGIKLPVLDPRVSVPLPVLRANRTQPLCMAQEYRLLSSYRRPDGSAPHWAGDTQALLYRRRLQKPDCPIRAVTLSTMRVPCVQFYKVDVEQDGVILSEGDMFSQLRQVLAAAERQSHGSPPVGVLTAVDRSVWAEARRRLSADVDNRNNLDIIEHSLFILCLDTRRRTPFSASAAVPEKEEEEEDLTNLAHYALHGQGTDYNSCNRWFDKTIQMVLSEDGSFGAIGEHSAAEGGPMMASVNHMLTFGNPQSTCVRDDEQRESRCLEEPLWLKWTTTAEIESDIARAKEEVDRNIQRPDVCGRTFEAFGREFAKGQGISPDTFLQLAIQLTYYRLYGRLAMTYESATLRQFRHGREDNIRINSPAVLAWTQAMCGDVHKSEAEKLALFKSAMEWKEKYHREAVAGHGIDNHLIGLREAARDLNVLDSVPLFSDPSFLKAFYFPLSTSQVPSTLSFFSFFGPLVPDGYGVGYKLFPDCMKLCVTSFHDCAETDSRKFTSCLESCLLEIHDFCVRKNQEL